jgi:hypothetical protein
MVNYLFRTHDPRLYAIILHRTRYYNHIRVQYGIEVESIQTVVENPDFITADFDDEYKENYYAQGVLPDAPALFLKVCVLFKQDVGRVLTAFEVEAPRAAEDVLWQK